MTFTTAQENKIKLYDCTKFLNIYNDLKQEVAATCVVKSRFLNNLANSGADFKKIFESTNKFTSLNLKID